MTAPGKVYDDCEKDTADQIAMEMAVAAGTSVDVYSVRRARNRDPLYGEPTGATGGWSYAGPWAVPVVFLFEEGGDLKAVTGETGFSKAATAKLFLARKQQEVAGMDPPKEGDVVHVWDGYGNEHTYWDVVRVARTGRMADTVTFMKYECDLSRNTKFDPKRKLKDVR